MANENEIDDLLQFSEAVSQKLNKALVEASAGKKLDLVAAYYSVARFVAGFIDDIRPVFGDDVLDQFTSTVNDILQAFETEGKDDTGKLLKYHPPVEDEDTN